MTAVEVLGGTEVPFPADGWLGGRFKLEERISSWDAGRSPGVPVWPEVLRPEVPAWPGVSVRPEASVWPEVSVWPEISVWKATDRLLCRPVTVHLLPAGRPVPRAVAEAVQAAARVSDPRLATIYDTDYGTDCPYIVSEWAPGTHLEDLVRSGLPSPALASAMIADAADALAVAHRAGRPHLCLTPRSLSWGGNCGLKITGLGIDAALRGTDLDDPLADTMALGRMLYALLTGCWPGPAGSTALPPAPSYRGRLCTPRQVRAGVPAILDAITVRAMQGQAPDAPLRPLPPAALALVLRGVQRPSHRLAAPEEPAVSRPRARHARTRTRLRTSLLRPAA